MKFRYLLLTLPLCLAMAACGDDEDVKAPGNPVMEYGGLPSTVCFGDELPFTVKASDGEVPLSTVKAELYIDGELVDTETVRTKVSGEYYTGHVSVPYPAYAEGSRGKLRLVLQNIHFTTTETEEEFDLVYPEFPYVTLRAEGGAEYRLENDGEGNYSATQEFPAEVRGVIVAPAYGENGREITFGYKGNSIESGGTQGISFRSLTGGAYTISFNTRTYDFSPTGTLKFDDTEFTADAADVYAATMYFESGAEIATVGFPAFSEWWVDPDYFIVGDNGKLRFNAASGNYQVLADMAGKFFTVYPLDEYGEKAVLQGDGSGAIWLMGTGIGKPDFVNYQPGWGGKKVIPFAPIGGGKHRLTVVAGKQLSATKFTLRIFEQPKYSTTFKPDRLTLETDLLIMNVPGKENHNIYLNDCTLEEGATYEIIVDLSAGNDAAVLTMTKK